MRRSYTAVGRADAAASTSVDASVPGKRTLTDALPVQLRAVVPSAPAAEDAQTTAARGVAGTGAALPFADLIAESFGPAHAETVRGISAHTGGAASAAAQDLGAHAYATGNAVAFGGAPDLHTAAHEAAHVVQQRQGVSLKGGVGAAGDVYEQHADAVADRVVAGRSAGDLLGGAVTAASADHPMDAVQLSPAATVSSAEYVYGGIVSKTQDPNGTTCTVIVDRGTKDGVHPGMTLAFSWLGGALVDGYLADSYEAKDDTTVAHVTATLQQLARCDSAGFIP